MFSLVSTTYMYTLFYAYFSLKLMKIVLKFILSILFYLINYYLFF